MTTTRQICSTYTALCSRTNLLRVSSKQLSRVEGVVIGGRDILWAWFNVGLLRRGVTPTRGVSCLAGGTTNIVKLHDLLSVLL